MFKKVILIVGAVLLGGVAIFAGVLFWAQRSGSQMQESFFTAVTSGDVKQLETLMDPALREQIDPPVLEAWMNEVRGSLGRYRGLSKTNFSTETRYEGGAWISQSQGEVHFERGTAQSELVFRDNQLIKFSVRSDEIGDDWFQGPADSKLYRERGQEFLTHFLLGESDRAFEMMHEALQREMPREKLRALVDDVTAKAGKLQSIAYAEERFDTSQGQRLKIYYQVQCEHARTTARVDIQFAGLQGHLVAFDLTGE